MLKFRMLKSSNRIPTTTGSKHAFRSAGDQARDIKHWGEAAAYYSKFLEQLPGDVSIRIQLGNCLKEAGRLNEALKAYDIAIALDARHADAHLQRGHLLKMMGRQSEAVEEYRKSFEQNSKNNPAFEELLALEALRDAAFFATSTIIRTQSADATIYIDITDLIEYLRVNTSLSGIQRVVSNLVANAQDFSAMSENAIKPVLPDYNGSKVFTVRISLLEGLIGLVANGQSSREELNRAIDSVLASRSLAALKFGDTLLIPGAFWIYQRYDLLNIMRQNGVRVTVFIHDLIQITNPEFVEPAATTVFRRSIVDTLCVSSYILTNSQFVADDVGRYIRERMNFEIPIKPITLATELGLKRPDLTAVHADLLEMSKDEYVLCVGTIEIRKNHMYAVGIWERLIAEFPEKVPNLVFVGKWGWEIAPLQRWLAASDYLGGRLYIYHEISDTDLAFLYQNCLFTLYPSFAEGWGLPVGESLGYGKPCVASKVTAIPEVGGELCKYVDPFDLEDGHRVVADILGDRPALEAWTARVQTEFSPKTWKSFSNELFKTVQQYAQDPTLKKIGNNCILESGEIATFGNDPLAYLDALKKPLVTARMSRMEGWHGLESWGCWAAKRKATLRFNTHMESGTDVVVYLHLKAPDGDELADCTIRVSQTMTFIDQLGTVPLWSTALGKVGDGGVLDLLLISGKGFFHRHGRELYVGILGVAIAPVADIATRFELLGRIVPGGVPLQQG